MEGGDLSQESFGLCGVDAVVSESHRSPGMTGLAFSYVFIILKTQFSAKERRVFCRFSLMQNRILLMRLILGI